ncbi:uncharacterized mitochondrial protein AtMg00310-like [Rutidosis leptorrhynchoides]|uniref:uncharacterized mitochondrial protein AtMg00310-like n=1 Tax=Rutidosis leptorrhynchoides TaxID=125765 RepID=UPI003A9A23FE
MGSLGIYLLSLFKCPESNLKRLESIRARFFWGGSNKVKKMSWVKWDKILAPLDRGGLNVGSLKGFNLALIHKWRWRYLSNPNDYWVAIIKSIHGNKFEQVSRSCTSMWSAIVSSCNKTISDGILPADVIHIIHMHVENGTNVRFWHDLWCGSSILSSRFNRLFHLDVNQNDSIADKCVNGEWQWVWSRGNIGSRNFQLLDVLRDEISFCQLSDCDDRWMFSLCSDGIYSVKSTKLCIDRHILPASNTLTSW